MLHGPNVTGKTASVYWEILTCQLLHAYDTIPKRICGKA